MNKLIGVIVSLPALLSATPSPWDQRVIEGFSQVCSFCHYEKYMDYDTDTLVQENVLANAEAIIERLSKDPESDGIMPPVRSGLELDAEVRKLMIQTLEEAIKVKDSIPQTGRANEVS